MDYEQILRRNGGVVSTAHLVAASFSDYDIRGAVAAGSIRRVRHGWLAVGNADPDVVAAVAAGGALSCVSALSWHQVWVPPARRQVHFRTSKHRHHIADRCRRYGRETAIRFAIDDVATSLAYAVRCLDDEGIVVVADSLVNRRLLAAQEVNSILRSAPSGPKLLSRCDPTAESGTETMVRVRLRAQRIRVQPQFVVPGVGRVDFLVGDRLIIEVDSRAHHTGEAEYQSDRRRDRALTVRGYRVLRLTYADVVHRWPEVFNDILHLIRSREHLNREAG